MSTKVILVIYIIYFVHGTMIVGLQNEKTSVEQILEQREITYQMIELFDK